MSKYTFNIDTEQRIWGRHTVTIHADTYEQALAMAIDMAECSDIPDTAIYQRLEDTETETGRISIINDSTAETAYQNF